MEKSDTLDELLVKHGASKTFQQKDFLKELPTTLAHASGKSGTSKEAAALVRQKWPKQGEAIKELFTLSQQEKYRGPIVALGGVDTLSLIFESLELKLGQVDDGQSILLLAPEPEPDACIMFVCARYDRGRERRKHACATEGNAL
jgi:hypothetical protein